MLATLALLDRPGTLPETARPRRNSFPIALIGGFLVWGREEALGLCYWGDPGRGAWQHMGLLDGWDHREILGIGLEHGGQVLDFHRRWAAFLAILEA